MAETTVNQRALAFIIDRPNAGVSGLVYAALFLAQWTQRHKHMCAGFCQTVVCLAEKLARYRLDCYPGPFVSCKRNVAEA